MKKFPPALAIDAPGEEEEGQEARNARFEERARTLAYIAQMLVELRRLAVGVDEAMLVYLIEMAAQEADDCSRSNDFRDALLN